MLNKTKFAGSSLIAALGMLLLWSPSVAAQAGLDVTPNNEIVPTLDAAPSTLFSATDEYSGFVTDTCVQKDNFMFTASPDAAESNSIFDAMGFKMVGDGESVEVFGSSSSRVMIIQFIGEGGVPGIGNLVDPCCMCGIQDPSRPVGCIAYASPCCCMADISSDLQHIKCYCQGGRGC
ncbi:MAG: hypothetical protein ACYC2H_00030 [Thermoplasmatota archaeon]